MISSVFASPLPILPCLRFAKPVHPLSACLLLLAAFGLAPRAHAQTYQPLQDVSCGGEADRPCGSSDTAYHVANTRSAAGAACDYGLLPVELQPAGGMICANHTRHRLPNIFESNDPGGFVLHEQEQAIGADVPLNLVNTLGTHNSYANYTEGMNESYSGIKFDLSSLSFTAIADPFAADQYYSIADQLSSGARMIRLDPYFYQGQMRMCHGPIACDSTSDGRLFVYAVREVADWLTTHPGEFITIVLHDDNVSSDQFYLEDAPITKYLGNLLYSSGETMPKYPDDNGSQVAWPTLRQLRALRKQAVIFSTKSHEYAWQTGTYWTSDTDPDKMVGGNNLYAQGCLDNTNQDSRRRPFINWNNAGEDRSGSTTRFQVHKSLPFVTTYNEFGLMDSEHTNIAAKCGSSVIDLDFWSAMDHAFHLSVGLISADFRGPANDPRPLNASWSYPYNDSGIGPAVLDPSTQSWISRPSILQYHYACAAQHEITDVYSGLYDWAVSDETGPWSGGEAACQKTGANYHFWFPQSVYEQTNLLRYEIDHLQYPDEVWLNYRSATNGHQLTVSPQSVSVTMPVGATPPPQTIWFSGGYGLPVSLSYDGPYSPSQVYVDGSPANELLLTPVGSFSQPGTLMGNVTITEIDPVSSRVLTTTQIPVQVQVTTLTLSQNNVLLTPGKEAVVQVTSNHGSGAPIAFSVTGQPSWLTVEQSEAQTPAGLKFSATALSPGTYRATVQLVPANPGAWPTPINVTYNVQ